MVFNFSDFRVYAHRSKQFHVIFCEDNMRQECGTHHTRAVMTEPLLVSDVDDKHSSASSTCWTSFHPLTRPKSFSRSVIGYESRRSGTNVLCLGSVASGLHP